MTCYSLALMQDTCKLWHSSLYSPHLAKYVERRSWWTNIYCTEMNWLTVSKSLKLALKVSCHLTSASPLAYPQEPGWWPNSSGKPRFFQGILKYTEATFPPSLSMEIYWLSKIQFNSSFHWRSHSMTVHFHLSYIWPIINPPSRSLETSGQSNSLVSMTDAFNPQKAPTTTISL